MPAEPDKKSHFSGRPLWRTPWAWAAGLIPLAVGIYLYSDALGSGGGRVVGATDTETTSFLWGFFWMAHSILQEHALPYHTDLMDHPWGGTLWLKEPVFSILFMPLQLLFGVPLVYNLTGLAHGLIGAIALGGLARSLGVRPSVAIACGLTYGFNPHYLGEAYNGNLDAMNVGWSPLWLWAMVYAARAPGWRSVALASGALLLLLTGNQYYAIAMAAASGPILLMALFGPDRDQVAGGWLRGMGRVIGGVALGLVAFAPFGLALTQSIAAKDALTLIESHIPLMPPHVTDLLHIFRPLAPVSGDVPETVFQDIVYPGFAIAALALLAPLMAVGRRRWALVTAGLALFFFILMLGPVAFYDGRFVGDEHLYLPWHYLIEGKPIIGGMSLPHRMATPAALFISLSAALGLEGMARRFGAAGLAAAVALATGAFIEQISYPPYEIPLETVSVPRAHHARLLAELDEPGAVLNLPILVGQSRLRIYFWYQAIHRRPVDATFRMGRWPTIASEIPLLHQGVGPWLSNDRAPRRRRPAAEGDEWGIKRLREHGYAFVVYHATQVMNERSPGVIRSFEMMQAALGPGLVLRDGTVVFVLNPELQETLDKKAGAILGERSVIGYGEDWPAMVTQARFPVQRAKRRRRGPHEPPHSGRDAHPPGPPPASRMNPDASTAGQDNPPSPPGPPQGSGPGPRPAEPNSGLAPDPRFDPPASRTPRPGGEIDPAGER